MKTFLQIAIVGLFALASLNPALGKPLKSLKSNTDNIISVEYEFELPSIRNNGKYDCVEMDGTERHIRPGEPVLPVYPVRLLLPAGRKVLQVRAEVSDAIELKGEYNLAPGQKPRCKSASGPHEIVQPNPAIYGNNQPWPGINCKRVSIQNKRGYQILTVNVFPLQYVPTTSKLTCARKIRLEVSNSQRVHANTRCGLPVT